MAEDTFFTRSEIHPVDLAAFLDIKAFKTRVVSSIDFHGVVARLSFMKKDPSGMFKEIDFVEKSIGGIPSRYVDVSIFVSEGKIFLSVNNLSISKNSTAFHVLRSDARSSSWINDISESILLKGPIDIFTSSTSDDSSEVTGKIQLSVRLEHNKG